MKTTLLFLALLAIACSSHQEESSVPAQKEELVINSEKRQDQLHADDAFQRRQDSLRNILLESKPNSNLKWSILQELYIRGLVDQRDDSITFHLPFNLHGLDCGAPDCYSTDISFAIPATSPVTFPERVDFRLTEHGCVDQERSTTGVFHLQEESGEYVNYFSEKLKSNLIIKQSELYYYLHQLAHSVTVEAVDKMFANQDFEAENAIVPYRSTLMTTFEYEHFLDD